jgi:hypothetical protein
MRIVNSYSKLKMKAESSLETSDHLQCSVTIKAQHYVRVDTG